MFSEDLSVAANVPGRPAKRVLNVGWLSAEHDYRRGQVSADAVDRLWVCCCHPVDLMRGFHLCDWCCPEKHDPVRVQYGDETLVLGAAEIRVFGCGDEIFAAPDLVFHYVHAHSYRPPDVFLDALLSQPMPGTSAYETLLKSVGIHRIDAPFR